MFAIAWKYLTGRCVATDVADRNAAEWPPHPDRVFQALVASWGERGMDASEETALLWLESLPPPELAAPVGEPAAAPTVYVPPNDMEGPRRGAYGEKHRALIPAERPRKPRSFPATVVDDETCSVVWPAADPGEHRAALEALAKGVTYIGHSSSLVAMHLTERAPEVRFRPARPDERASLQLRTPIPGRFESLRAAYADGRRGWRRPDSAAWRRYADARELSAPCGEFSARPIVLRRLGGAPLGVSQTLDVARALRATLLPHLDAEALAVISGHGADGSPLRRPHATFLSLPSAGFAYSDGHLLGAAITLPADADYPIEDAVFGALVDAMDTDTATLTLRLSGGRETLFGLEERVPPPVALRSGTWCRTSTTWSTVTPLVLDRQAPRRHEDPDEFAREVIRTSLDRQGLPPPETIAIGPVSVLEGIPAAHAFPALPTKKGNGRRHVHAWLRFAEPCAGPLLLGAGRYRGYGFFRPVEGEVER